MGWGRMQPSSASDENLADMATVIALSMRSMGVVGLPRNYEIFYEVFTGSNPELSADFSALGSRPSQAALDELSARYFAQSSRQAIAEGVYDQIAARIREITCLLGRERNSLERFGTIVGQTSDGLSGRAEISRDLLQKIIGIMATATETTLEQGRQIAGSLAEKSAELEEVKSRLEEYRRLADTDPLTKISNRRAFDKRLAAIYDNERGVMFSALILADIDQFKRFNDRFGHPVGDKILQIVAKLLRANGGGDSFVARTGGEEFALVVEGLSENAIAQLAEKLRAAIAGGSFVAGQPPRSYAPITVSLGVCMAADASDPDDLYMKADRALYASKINGRNRVTMHSKDAAGRFNKNWLLYRRD